MFKLPVKYSNKWAYIFVALFGTTFLAFVLYSVILDRTIATRNLGGFALLSLLVAVIISAGGFLGAKGYFYTVLLFDLLGLIYMIYICINQTGDGFTDLISLMSYLFTLGIGIVLGIVVQVVLYIRSKRRISKERT